MSDSCHPSRSDQKAKNGLLTETLDVALFSKAPSVYNHTGDGGGVEAHRPWWRVMGGTGAFTWTPASC